MQSGIEKLASVEYHGKTFPGYNKPIPSDKEGKKMMVLAKKGDDVRLLHFGAKGYKHNYSPEAKQNYLSRSAGIRNGSGELTKDDPFSPNYWARRVLWPEGETGGGKSGPTSLEKVADGGVLSELWGHLSGENIQKAQDAHSLAAAKNLQAQQRQQDLLRRIDSRSTLWNSRRNEWGLSLLDPEFLEGRHPYQYRSMKLLEAQKSAERTFRSLSDALARAKDAGHDFYDPDINVFGNLYQFKKAYDLKLNANGDHGDLSDLLIAKSLDDRARMRSQEAGKDLTLTVQQAKNRASNRIESLKVDEQNVRAAHDAHIADLTSARRNARIGAGVAAALPVLGFGAYRYFNKKTDKQGKKRMVPEKKVGGGGGKNGLTSMEKTAGGTVRVSLARLRADSIANEMELIKQASTGMRIAEIGIGTAAGAAGGAALAKLRSPGGKRDKEEMGADRKTLRNTIILGALVGGGGSAGLSNILRDSATAREVSGQWKQIEPGMIQKRREIVNRMQDADDALKRAEKFSYRGPTFDPEKTTQVDVRNALVTLRLNIEDVNKKLVVAHESAPQIDNRLDDMREILDAEIEKIMLETKKSVKAKYPMDQILKRLEDPDTFNLPVNQVYGPTLLEYRILSHYKNSVLLPDIARMNKERDSEIDNVVANEAVLKELQRLQEVNINRHSYQREKSELEKTDLVARKKQIEKSVREDTDKRLFGRWFGK